MSTTDEHDQKRDAIDEQVDPEIIDEHEAPEEGEPSLEQQLAELDDRYRRALADYQNFQRRSIENEQRAREHGAAEILKAMVPVLDNARLAMQMDPETSDAQQVLTGVKGIVDQFFATMARFGVEPIEPAPGEEFNPGRHEAMLQTPSEEVEPGHIVQVLQIGYALRDRVVRPAQVAVCPQEGEG